VPADISRPLPTFAWHWYDVAHDELLAMAPVPPPGAIAEALRERIPYRAQAWHPFTWTSRPSGRLTLH
jgi:hypothetical protein